MFSYCKKMYTSFNKLGSDFIDAFASSRAKKIAAAGMGTYLAGSGALIATVAFYSSKAAGFFVANFLQMPVLSSIGLAVFGTLGIVSGLATIATIGGIAGIAKNVRSELSGASAKSEVPLKSEMEAPAAMPKKAGDDFNVAGVHRNLNATKAPSNYFIRKLKR